LSRARLLLPGVTTLLSGLLAYVLDARPATQSALLTTVTLVCVLEFPIVLLTGSSIRPCHLLLFGAGVHNPRPEFGSWICYVAGFLLRVVSIFGLLETFLILSLAISAPPAEWPEFSRPGRLAAMVLAAFYFPTSVYFSFKTPRKLLLPTVVFLNVPLAVWIFGLATAATEASVLLSYCLSTLLGLWAGYTVAFLIAPAPVQPAIKSWRATMATRIFPTNACQVER
jgi:hypothetical protein